MRACWWEGGVHACIHALPAAAAPLPRRFPRDACTPRIPLLGSHCPLYSTCEEICFPRSQFAHRHHARAVDNIRARQAHHGRHLLCLELARKGRSEGAPRARMPPFLVESVPSSDDDAGLSYRSWVLSDAIQWRRAIEKCF
jgi:hypothetical protein